MKSVINSGKSMALGPCCGGMNWLTKKTFNLVIPDDEAVVEPSFLLMEDGTSYILLEDNASKIELE